MLQHSQQAFLRMGSPDPQPVGSPRKKEKSEPDRKTMAIHPARLRQKENVVTYVQT
jgi:hypothetical protein